MSATDRPESLHGRRVAVIIPTYNERENLESISARVRSAVPGADLLVVDDNSPDGTGDLADKLAVEDGKIHVLHRPGKAGLGAAYIAGFGWALEHGYDAMVEMDADGSHQPEELPKLLAAMEAGADVVIGSRWVRGGTVRNWPKSREFLSRGANTYARIMLGIKVRDATGGFRVYRADTLRKIGLDQVLSQGYCFQIDLTLRALIGRADRHRGADHLHRPHPGHQQDGPVGRRRGVLAGRPVGRAAAGLRAGCHTGARGIARRRTRLLASGGWHLRAVMGPYALLRWRECLLASSC